MPAASFVHTNGRIDFSRGPRRPEQSLDIVQPQRKTAGGRHFGYAQTITSAIIDLPLRLTTGQKNQLLDFFNTIVNGMAEVFIYTNTDGTALSVRFAVPRLDNLAEVAYDAWKITVPLRVVA